MGGPIDPRSDQELIQQGDFDALYWRYRDWVVGLAYRFTLHSDDSLDVLQETFVYVARKFPTLKLTASMKTFLYPAVRHLSLEILRKRRGGASLDEEAMGLAAPSVSMGSSELAAALAALSDGHRQVVLLRFVDGMKIDEIAVVLKLPEGTVKSRLHNALQQLKDDPRAMRYLRE